MNANKNDVSLAQKEIEDLGYTTELKATNSDKPDQIQQMFVYKGENDTPIARVSLMIACKIDTMSNRVGRKEVELLKILGRLSMSI